MAIFPALLALLLVGSPPRAALHLERCHGPAAQAPRDAPAAPPLAAARPLATA